MALKNILVQLDATKASPARLAYAMALARTHDAHLIALSLVAEPYIPAAVGVSVPPEVVRQQRAMAEAEAEEQLEGARKAARQAGVPVETRHETVSVDRLADSLARQARHVDLAIVGQPDPDAGGGETFVAEAAFMQSGRPAILVPYVGTEARAPQRVLCAWNGTREAARAINDAMPLLEKALKVTVLVVDPQRHEAQLGAAPGADIATHLARHGLKVEVKPVQSGGMGVGDVLLSTASDESADLLVMGGYGHSRLREMVLGGTTAHLLHHMTVPVLMAH
ncbi:universal stress protein [Marinimicrococcus flavescens]|uniref:Universal stress protein n=1 Tax=Marinimicrococcus flavescens TaxID=3031815 RepID=A0AAP4D6K3_9PROT|nr:universal stress protein [Marinimicrococcus flavescens]